MKCVKLDCGLHWGSPRPDGDRTCHKCRHLAQQMADPKFRAGLQYSGTPWNAILGPVKEET